MHDVRDDSHGSVHWNICWAKPTNMLTVRNRVRRIVFQWVGSMKLSTPCGISLLCPSVRKTSLYAPIFHTLIPESPTLTKTHMSTSLEHQIWNQTIQIVLDDPEVGRATAGQLGLAIPRGIAAHTLYLAVAHDLTMQLVESRLRSAIMRAFAQIPEASDIKTFVVLVDPEVANEISQQESQDERDDGHADDSWSNRTQNSDWQGSREGDREDFAPPADIRDYRKSDSGDGSGHDSEPDSRNLWQSERQDFDNEGFGGRRSEPRPQRPIRSTGRHAGEKFGIEPRLNSKYGFDTFVIGQSNRFAHAAAVAVAEAPARAYNPLFIYGDSGLGKTHLLHAIGLYALEMFPDIQIRYVSSEDFTNDFINSIANNRGTQFHSRYRNVDLLLVDDIQFLQGKAETLFSHL